MRMRVCRSRASWHDVKLACSLANHNQVDAIMTEDAQLRILQIM